LRYPGGKQKLTPFIREIIESNGLEGGHYVEPYAGGAGVAMELLVDGVVGHVHLNDSSLPIYAFWSSILNDTDEFCRKIERTPLTVAEWRRQREVLRNAESAQINELGFATFYLNRTNRSGVLSGGVIGGLEQTGQWKIDARFPRQELIRRVELIASLRDSIAITCLDAEQYFVECVELLPENSLIYCDPPYFEKANRLYLNHYAPDDHQRIASMIRSYIDRKWVVSYDGVPEILKYYKGCRKFLYDLQYNASKAYKGKEVFIFGDTIIVPRRSVLPFISEGLKRSTRSLHYPRPQQAA
jgi:DNA adenine methylase